MTAINRSSAAAARLQNVTSVTAAGRPAVTAVRALLWVLLWFNAWLPLRGFLSLPLVFGFLLFSLALGVWGYRLRLRFWCLLAVGVLFPLIVRGAAGIAGILLFHDPVGAPGESLPAILDRNILILILPSMITAGSIYWGIRDERWVLPEILLQGAFLIPLFYD